MNKHLFSPKVYLLDFALLFFRVGTAIGIGTHGWPKIINFSDYLNRFADPIGLGPAVSLQLAIFAEFFCAILLGLGFLTRIALITLIITMGIIVFIVHINDPWVNLELPVSYLISFLFLLFTGPGKYSIDNQMVRENRY